MQEIRKSSVAFFIILLGILSHSIASTSSEEETVEESVKSLKEAVQNLGQTVREATSDGKDIHDASCKAKSDKNCDGESATKGGTTYKIDKDNTNTDIKDSEHESKDNSGENVNTGRDARMVLKDKYGDLPYTVEYESGPSHAPVYAAEVTVEGQVFKGSGTSKKRAKLSAAENACIGLKLNC